MRRGLENYSNRVTMSRGKDKWMITFHKIRFSKSFFINLLSVGHRALFPQAPNGRRVPYS